MQVTIQISASHLGYFEFRICPNNNRTRAITHECLDQYLLEIVGSPHTTKFYDQLQGMYELEVRLPAGLTCSQCVVQWRYHTGMFKHYPLPHYIRAIMNSTNQHSCCLYLILYLYLY